MAKRKVSKSQINMLMRLVQQYPKLSVVAIVAIVVVALVCKYIDKANEAQAAEKTDTEIVIPSKTSPVPSEPIEPDKPSPADLPQHVDLMKVLPADPGLIQYKGMDVSFNKQYHVPNYVAWELTADETYGTIARKQQFFSDPNVEGCPETYDYSRSGYDRGHMAPAGDMKWDDEAMHNTFYLTNICPQANVLNTGAWKHLEDKCRLWARTDSAIVIVCGPILTDKIKEYIGQDTRVAVPKRFFKVILSPYTNPPRGIGFIMPNDKVPGGMQQCAVSIDSVEAVTKLDFFSALPDNIERKVEKECDFHFWSTKKEKL